MILSSIFLAAIMVCVAVNPGASAKDTNRTVTFTCNPSQKSVSMSGLFMGVSLPEAALGKYRNTGYCARKIQATNELVNGTLVTETVWDVIGARPLPPIGSHNHNCFGLGMSFGICCSKDMKRTYKQHRPYGKPDTFQLKDIEGICRAVIDRPTK